MEVESDEEGPAPAAAAPPAQQQAATTVQQEVPSHILLVEELPAEATDDMLTVLFQQFVVSLLTLIFISW